MEDTQILNLWKSYDKKLEENLTLNRKNTEDITRMKVQSFLGSMKPLKLFTILTGLVWVGFVDVIIIGLFNIASPFFLVSAIVQVALTKLAIAIYLYQIILIHSVDIAEPVLETQEKLARLKSSTIWVARLLLLQLPVWTIFYWNESMISNGSTILWIIQGAVTGLFTFAAVWLSINIRYENKDKKWFRLLFEGYEWTPVIRSMELLRQVKGYKD